MPDASLAARLQALEKRLQALESRPPEAVRIEDLADALGALQRAQNALSSVRAWYHRHEPQMLGPDDWAELHQILYPPRS